MWSISRPRVSSLTRLEHLVQRQRRFRRQHEKFDADRVCQRCASAAFWRRSSGHPASLRPRPWFRQTTASRRIHPIGAGGHRWSASALAYCITCPLWSVRHHLLGPDVIAATAGELDTVEGLFAAILGTHEEPEICFKATMNTTNPTAPTAMPAIATPRGPSLVRVIRLSAITPRTMPTIDPMPHRKPNPEDTSDQYASVVAEDDPHAPAMKAIHSPAMNTTGAEAGADASRPAVNSSAAPDSPADPASARWEAARIPRIADFRSSHPE